MLSEEKIKKMLRLSEYETGQGSIDLRRVRYMKMDYVRLEIIKTVAATVIAFVLAAGLLVLYQADFIFANALSLPLREILIWSGCVFVPLCTVCVVTTWRVAARLYEESHARAKIYYTTLQELLELYDEEEQRQEETDT